MNPYALPSSYISCIRIAGAPILPPLMTAKRFAECMKMRCQALAVEVRLTAQRQLCVPDPDDTNSCLEDTFNTSALKLCMLGNSVASDVEESAIGIMSCDRDLGSYTDSGVSHDVYLSNNTIGSVSHDRDLGTNAIGSESHDNDSGINTFGSVSHDTEFGNKAIAGVLHKGLSNNTISSVTPDNELENNAVGSMSYDLGNNAIGSTSHDRDLGNNAIGSVTDKSDMGKNAISSVSHDRDLSNNAFGSVLHDRDLGRNTVGNVLHYRDLGKNAIHSMSHDRDLGSNVNSGGLHDRDLGNYTIDSESHDRGLESDAIGSLTHYKDFGNYTIGSEPQDRGLGSSVIGSVSLDSYLGNNAFDIVSHDRDLKNNVGSESHHRDNTIRRALHGRDLGNSAIGGVMLNRNKADSVVGSRSLDSGICSTATELGNREKTGTNDVSLPRPDQLLERPAVVSRLVVWEQESSFPPMENGLEVSAAADRESAIGSVANHLDSVSRGGRLTEPLPVSTGTMEGSDTGWRDGLEERAGSGERESSLTAELLFESCDSSAHGAVECSSVDDAEYLPPRLVRRNSYTLMTPSPGLLMYLNLLGSPAQVDDVESNLSSLGCDEDIRENVCLKSCDRHADVGDKDAGLNSLGCRAGIGNKGASEGQPSACQDIRHRPDMRHWGAELQRTDHDFTLPSQLHETYQSQLLENNGLKLPNWVLSASKDDRTKTVAGSSSLENDELCFDKLLPQSTELQTNWRDPAPGGLQTIELSNQSSVVRTLRCNTTNDWALSELNGTRPASVKANVPTLHWDTMRKSDKDGSFLTSRSLCSVPSGGVRRAGETSSSLWSKKHLQFPTSYSPQEKAAAIVLTAAVRGHLTRRLMQTERVSQVKETIRSSLQCALALHNEKTLTDADIDLHGRLIHQLTAACYEFHDIFFALPVWQQMRLIAADRERLQKPSYRPFALSDATRRTLSRKLVEGQRRTWNCVNRPRSKSFSTDSASVHELSVARGCVTPCHPAAVQRSSSHRQMQQPWR